MIKYFEFRKIKIRYSDKGKGRAIVLIHGFPGSLDIWNTFSESLAKHFRVIAIDLPGFGESPPIGYIHSMELFAECIKQLIDKLNYRKYVLCGHSMGGYVALAFAELYTKNVSGISLFHSNAFADSEEKKKDRTRAIELVKHDAKHYVSELVNKLFAEANKETHKNAIEHIRKICLGTTKEGIINALGGMRDRKDRTSILKTANYPIQFILGKKDAVMPFDALIKQVDLCKHPVITTLENSGHMGFIEEMERSQKALLRFTRKCFRETVK